MPLTPFMSQIMPVAFNFAPQGWAQCNGQLLPINQNQPLFSLLGTTYGGDGQTTFGLPNMSDVNKPFPTLTWIIATEGIYPQRP